ncbi:hypothetical protein HPP92_020788 [Vanilla planifolia]|uniref:Uncharacterized protein n=1 Tax=Vanilla planifolia TaxID=51239 RepID=A0A835Q6N7_VANPL|nr:hypothetical protein HPP92_020788 [Vanilla planifolia]
MFMKTKQDVTYVLLLEIQFIIGLSATVFCAVGMAVNKDFQAISREGELYGLGETKYYAMVVFIAIIAQIFSVGLVATINYSSALLGGIVIAACIPLAEVLAVFLLHEKFDGEKGVALALSLWGTASYFYGQYKDYQRGKTIAVEMDRCQDRLPVSVTDSDSFGGSQSSLIKQQKNYGDDRTG